jgi:quercetin dioxygenase-like cupin family protein
MTDEPFNAFSRKHKLNASWSGEQFTTTARQINEGAPMTGYEESRHAPHQRESLTRLPELGDTVIRRNINDELEKLEDAPSLQLAAGRSSETIVKYPEFRIVLVRMKQGSYMSHHRAEGPISVHVVLGKIRIHLPDERMEELGSGDLLALERGLEHDVEALEDCAFLLTIAWPQA